MKAAVFHGAHEALTIEDVDMDSPRPHEVIVRTIASGVCHSDLHFVDGSYPMQAPAILGHEGAGIIEAVGDQVTYVQPGDHVICCLSAFCGQCDNCLVGRPYICRNTALLRRLSSDTPKYTWRGERVGQFAGLGSYAERMLVHENAVVQIRDDMPLARAALIGCGVTTGVGAALNTAQVEPGSSVAVFGAGGVGISVVQGARIAGAGMIIAVDTVEAKLGWAKEMGATHVVDASSRDPVEAIRALTGGAGAEYSFEAIGDKRAAEQAYECLDRGGTATIIGMIPVGQKIEIDGPSMLAGKRLQGSVMGSNRFRRDMPRYVDFYMQGLLQLDEMITRRGRLEDVNEAFRAMKAGEVVRTVLMFD
jgi:S-(hydroxymethyl)glutathione dehydrogenase/alcohol dehydrogenase